MQQRSSSFFVRVRAPLACFTRPELKTERVSYDVMTPSAARGVLDAILWKPAIVWRVERIKVLAPIAFASIKRNEVNHKISADSALSWMNGTQQPESYFADSPSNRAQRHTLALRDVDYIIDCHFEMTDHRGPDDNLQKFEEMFARRLSKGQCFHRPYLGCREFAADFEPAAGDVEPIHDTRDLGRMLYDLDYGRGRLPLFFDAALVEGVLEIPPRVGEAAS